MRGGSDKFGQEWLGELLTGGAAPFGAKANTEGSVTVSAVGAGVYTMQLSL